MDIESFTGRLCADHQLLKINTAVDGRLEIAALTDHVCKQAGPGLLFSSVKGSQVAVATNLFGSDQRMARALGFDSLSLFGDWLRAELSSATGESSAERLRILLEQVNAEPLPSLRVQRAVDLGFLPDIQFWPNELRSFLTLAVVITRAPDSAEQNFGLYRVGLAGERRLTLNLLPGSGAGRHQELWKKSGQKMPIAIILGADPSLIYAAAAPLPHQCNEAEFSAFLLNKKYQYCRCETVPLQCPTSGQIVIEGWLDDEPLIDEGPFGCFKGNYGGSNLCPLIEVSAVSMVENPLLPLTLAGPLPMEDCWIAKTNLEILRARLAIDMPEIGSFEMPLDSAFHGLYFARCTTTDMTVESLVEELHNLDYLRHLKMLVLLGPEESISDLNWRNVLKQITDAQIWQDPDADMAALLEKRPSIIAPDPGLQKELMQRLHLDLAGFSGSFDVDRKRSDG